MTGPLAVTPGEPAGIGPDLCLMLARRDLGIDWVAVADPRLLEDRARHLDLPVSVRTLAPGAPIGPRRVDEIRVVPVPLQIPAAAGALSSDNAPYVLETLRAAVQGCLDARFAALVTGPVHKGIINEAGIPFTGHTEFLAALTGGEPVMMLAAPGLRVALASTHLPLSEVPRAITRAGLERVVTVLDRDLRARFGIAAPAILVCGLNPHAGEGGHLGREEIEVIAPTLDALRRRGLNLLGPLPADTAFTPGHLEAADAVLAMYHDQGLPVLKHMGFGRAVNVTLGLPIVRTSVDHGTALELAATGRADPGSLEAALRLAAQLVPVRAEPRSARETLEG